jgi:acyl-coenzyme A synthetase/AMP-(fatty) acid ligase
MTRAAADLARLLSSERAPEAPVAWRTHPGARDREIAWAEFRAQVATLRDRLAVWPEGRVALFTQDSYAFAVGLFAIWHAGRIAVCPPNDQPGTLQALANLVIGGVSDGPLDVPDRPLASTEELAPGAEPEFEPLAHDAVVAELFTSGTTGRGKAIAKTLDHLSLEVASLERQFGRLAGGAAIFASASHQHLYGMLFRVLWPLATTRPFHGSTLLHAEELLPRLRERGACVLASVPAHLKRLAERGGLEELGAACRLVFSSGGPLAPETAERWERACGAAPIEIFGSTETGGVASRRQGRGRANTPWTPFPEVSVRADGDGRLRVLSPFASGDSESVGFAMGDRVTLEADGRFALGGRIDRVLKIGEKRLSLPDMEERLIEHPWVGACALLPLERGGEMRVAAAVVLAPPGVEALAESGRRAVTVVLGDSLAQEWDRTLLPRSWRFVAALPEDAQGKVTKAALQTLFGTTAAETPA